MLQFTFVTLWLYRVFVSLNYISEVSFFVDFSLQQVLAFVVLYEIF